MFIDNPEAAGPSVITRLPKKGTIAAYKLTSTDRFAGKADETYRPLPARVVQLVGYAAPLPQSRAAKPATRAPLDHIDVLDLPIDVDKTFAPLDGSRRCMRSGRACWKW